MTFVGPEEWSCDFIFFFSDKDMCGVKRQRDIIPGDKHREHLDSSGCDPVQIHHCHQGWTIGECGFHLCPYSNHQWRYIQ